MDKLTIRVGWELRPSHKKSGDHDWSATTDSYEPGDPVGYGPDRYAAMIDLLKQLDEKENG